jgi:hypothetical protein
MTISILGLHCLNAVTDDYETAASIVEDVRRSSHGLVTTAEVTTALEEMLGEGLVEAFRFDPASQRFVASVEPRGDGDDVWYRVSQAGRAELNANWVDD